VTELPLSFVGQESVDRKAVFNSRCTC